MLKSIFKQTLFRFQLTSVLAVSVLISLSGITLLPLESHEAFVLASAQSMFDSQDWIVPWFNGEPRLTKPPLQYWLTAMTAYVSGGISQIHPWHGRLPSALAAIGIVVLTIVTGRKLFGARHGLLAGLMLASSSGFYFYAHSARPEMVYAFFCTAALTSYIYADKSIDGSLSQRISSILIWVSFALATLTKGPQIPIIFLIAFVIDLLSRKQSLRAVVHRLRPVQGSLLFVLIALPWWWLLEHKVGSLRGTQLSGTLLKIDLKNILDPYYLYRPFQLMLPWASLLPTLFLIPWRRFKASYWLMIALIVLSAIALSFGHQKRWYYMLPLLAPMFLVLAAGVADLLQRLERRNDLLKHTGWIFVAIPILFVVVINTPFVISKKKAAYESLAVTAREQVEKGQKLILWETRGASEVFIYYARHQVICIDNAIDLQNLIANAPEQRFLLVTSMERLDEIPSSIRYRLIRQVGSQGSSLDLLELL